MRKGNGAVDKRSAYVCVSKEKRTKTKFLQKKGED